MTRRRPLLLLVDDDRDIGQALGWFLEHEGYEVVQALHGLEALERVREEGLHPDAILLDLKMPVMDGERFCLARRAEPALEDVPILLLTAYSDVDDEEAARLGAVGRVPKPIDLDWLVEALRRHVG